MQKTGPTEPQRIAKLLARAGVASRREIERMIEDGRIALNGAPLTTPATILTSLRGVTVDGVAVQEAEAARLFLFHKPPGVLTAAHDLNGRATIYDRLPADLPRLMPVGRLDLNTEGLLLLTSDGEFKRALELPATGVERAYRARAYGDVTQAQLEDLIEGVEIEGIRYGSINANLERRTGANVWIEMILTEGKNREVRRVLEYLGLQVSRLIRTRYGPFILGDLPVGGVGEVRQHDLEAFRASLKGNKNKAVEEARDKQITVTGRPKPRRAEPAKPTVEPDGVRRVRAAAPRKREVREDLDTRPQRPQRPQRSRPDESVPVERGGRAFNRSSAGPASPGERGGRAFNRSAAAPARPDRPVRPGTSAAGAARGGDRPNATPARTPREGTGFGAGQNRQRSSANPHISPARNAPPPWQSGDQRPRPEPDREDISTRPRRARAGAVTERPETASRPIRGAGWAKAKPKPGGGPKKPRKPRA